MDVQTPTSAGEEGGAVARPLRILQREWKRNKPHLPKSTSLPVLQLTPRERPIFTCCRCGFANTLIPMCLWCCWTSDAAHRAFELSMPRARRASAPPRIFWQQRREREWRKVAMGGRRGAYITMASAQATSPGTHISSTRPAENEPLGHAPDHPRQGTQGEGWSCRPTSNLALGAEDHPPHHHDAHHETPPETVRVATATSSTLAFADSPCITRRRSDESVRYDWTAGSSHQNQNQNRRSTPMPLSARPSHKGVDRPTTTMHAIKKLSTKSLRSTQLVIDLKNIHESYDILKPDSSSRSARAGADPPATPKTLRRRKRMTLFRASLAATSPSEPDSASVTSHPPEHLPLPFKATHTRSQSQPHPVATAPASVRLGHPSRPYYTAIRPHLSRPASPVEPAAAAASLRPPTPSGPSRPLSLPPPPRAPSPGIFSVLSTTSFLSMPERARDPLPAFSSSAPPQAHGPPFAFGSSLSHRAGFSLSGEVELRMAIAREQAEFGVPEEERYRYRVMAQAPCETRVMKKVNKLKRGLKDFVSRKA